jgi:hypothetical protein
MKKQFTTADLIRPPLHTCPKCKAEQSFGVLLVSDASFVRRCRNCWHTETNPLPPTPRRKVVYLDQFVISEIMKARRGPKTSGRRDPYWADLDRSLVRTLLMQLAAFPDSPFHDEETGLARDKRDIQDALGALSGGFTFVHYLTLQQDQLRQGAAAWAAGRSPSEIEIDQEAAIHGNLQSWQDSISIYIPPGDLPAETGRSRKQAAQNLLIPTLLDRAKRGSSFTESLHEEAGSFGPTLRRLIWQEALRKRELYAGRLPQTLEDFLPSVNFEFFMAIRNGIELGGYTGQDVDFKAFDFMGDPAIAEVPFVHLRALLYAGLSRKMVAGQAPPAASIATDFEMIATFLPYCDAMFLDRQCAGLLAENPIREEVERYRTRVFSKGTQVAFTQYLSGLERDLPPFHLDLVREVFGERF